MALHWTAAGALDSRLEALPGLIHHSWGSHIKKAHDSSPFLRTFRWQQRQKRSALGVATPTPLQRQRRCAHLWQSHAPQHADARHGCWGPLRVVGKLRITERPGFRCVPKRFFERKIFNFAAAKNFRKFRSEIARILTCRSMPTLGTDVGDL